MTVLLKPEDYYTQRNNKIEPFEACLPTARVMWYIANHIPYVNYMPTVYSDDDFFMWLLRQPEAVIYKDRKYPWAKGIPANEVHGMYGSYLDEKVTGKRRSDFVQNLSFDEVVRRVKNGEAIMTSGAFQGRTGRIDGHGFVFVGVDDNECLLMADPYGSFLTNYESDKGYLVPMSNMEYIEHVKPVGAINKFGHIRML